MFESIKAWWAGIGRKLDRAKDQLEAEKAVKAADAAVAVTPEPVVEPVAPQQTLVVEPIIAPPAPQVVTPRKAPARKSPAKAPARKSPAKAPTKSPAKAPAKSTPKKPAVKK